MGTKYIVVSLSVTDMLLLLLLVYLIC